MRLVKRVKYVVALPAFVVATLATQLVAIVPTHAESGTDVWTGAGDGTHFSDGANWSTSTAPVTGDTLSFPAPGSDTTKTFVNDLTGVQFAGFSYGTVGSTHYSSYTFDKLAFQNNAIINRVGPGVDIAVSDSITAQSLTLSGNVNWSAVSHDINVSVANISIVNNPAMCAGSGSDFSVYWLPTGAATIGSGSAWTLAGTPTSVDVQTGGQLGLWSASGPVAYSGDITFEGGGATQGDSCGTPMSLVASGDVTLSGAINFTHGDIVYYVGAGKTLTVTGTLNGPGNKLTPSGDSTGTFQNNAASNNSTTAGGTTKQPVTEQPPVTDNQPSATLTVGANKEVALDGTRGDVYVDPGAILKGTGTANTLGVSGVVAPGHSPGKLTVLTTLNLYSGSEYQAELQNAGNYDQLVVGKNYSGGGNAVSIDTDAKLTVSLYSGWSIKQGDAFTIIDNQSTTAVSGTFNGMAEGTKITVDGVVFSISYHGGDGNDVVLTALNTGNDPHAPNTGVERFIAANPLPVAALGIVTAGILVAVALRRRSTR